MDYLDFELDVGPGDGMTYPVTVLQSPAGEARATMQFPFAGRELDYQLLNLQNALLRSASPRRRIASPEAEQVQAFGRDLFDALLTGDVRIRYSVSQAQAIREGKGLRVKLRIQPPELAALPWEFMYDPQQDDYVTLSHETPLVRYLELPDTPRPLTIAPPLRILGMVASPRDLESLNVTHEKQRIGDALQPARDSGIISLTWLEGQTWRDLQRAMRQGPWHVFHFVGHGAFSQTSDEGFIAFADEKGDTARFPATHLGRMLSGHRSLRLVVLNACEGAASSQNDLFSSTAATLVRRGIPAVLAMQYEITDGAAIELASTFYELLAEGAPVDHALSQARMAVSFALPGTFEWGTPVLFLRAPDGVLFKMEPGAAPILVQPPDTDTPRVPPSSPPAGLSPTLYRRLRDVLSASDAFASNRALRAVFVDARLIHWRNQIPHADSVSGRVEQTIGFLFTRQQEGTGANALVLLLHVLQDRVDEDDTLHAELSQLARELGEGATPIGTPGETGPASSLADAQPAGGQRTTTTEDPPQTQGKPRSRSDERSSGTAPRVKKPGERRPTTSEISLPDWLKPRPRLPQTRPNPPGSGGPTGQPVGKVPTSEDFRNQLTEVTTIIETLRRSDAYNGMLERRLRVWRDTTRGLIETTFGKEPAQEFYALCASPNAKAERARLLSQAKVCRKYLEGLL